MSLELWRRNSSTMAWIGIVPFSRIHCTLYMEVCKMYRPDLCCFSATLTYAGLALQLHLILWWAEKIIHSHLENRDEDIRVLCCKEHTVIHFEKQVSWIYYIVLTPWSCCTWQDDSGLFPLVVNSTACPSAVGTFSRHTVVEVLLRCWFMTPPRGEPFILK